MHLLLVDDHQLLCVAFSEHLKRIVAKTCPGPISVTTAFSLDGAIKALEEEGPDMVFLDLDLGKEVKGARTLRRFQECNKNNVPVILFTGMSCTEDNSIETLRECFNELNARGLLMKSADLSNSFIGLGRLLNGEFWVPQEVFMALASNTPKSGSHPREQLGLSPRQWTVAHGIMQGLQNKEIVMEINKSEKASITELYVRQIATQIYKKLGVKTRTAAAMVISGALDLERKAATVS